MYYRRTNTRKQTTKKEQPIYQPTTIHLNRRVKELIERDKKRIHVDAYIHSSIINHHL